MAHIAVILANFNRQGATLDCLRSPAKSTHVDRRMLVLNHGVTMGEMPA
jgi:GT2 family glycosyltransferase